MKKKINTIDSFIIVYLILALISLTLGLLYSVFVRGGVNDSYILRVRISDLDNETIAVMEQGDIIEFPDLSGTGTLVGEIELSPSVFNVYDAESGEYVSIEKNDRSDVVINIEISGYYTESGFRIGDNNLLTGGMEIKISSSLYSGSATVLDISDKNE